MARSSEPKVNATFRLPPDLLALLTAYAAVRTAEERKALGKSAKPVDRTAAVIELLRAALVAWMAQRSGGGTPTPNNDVAGSVSDKTG